MIWVDLDNTLVLVRNKAEERALARLVELCDMSSSVKFRPSQKGLRKLRRIAAPSGELHGCVRHGAHEFLAALRQLGEVRMLTAALRDYALAVNAEFKLGFEPAQIFAREDWLILKKIPEVRTRLFGQDPGGIMVGNRSDEWSNRQKVVYLGQYSPLIEVEDFDGFVADDFSERWPQLVEQIQILMSKTYADNAAWHQSEGDRRLAELDRRKAARPMAPAPTPRKKPRDSTRPKSG